MEFGFLFDNRRYITSNIEIIPLSDIDKSFDWLTNKARLSKGWIYPPLTELPLAHDEKHKQKIQESAVWYRFNPTHTVRISPDDPEKLKFIILGLGFLFGVYLSPAGYQCISRVPYKIGELTDIIPVNNDIEKGVEFLSLFYDLNPDKRIGMYAVIHWFLLGQTYNHPWDRFDSQYKVLDGLYKVSGLNAPTHAQRPVVLANTYGVQLPNWAIINGRQSTLSQMRNNLVHEAIYAGQPIGFNYPSDNFDQEFKKFNGKIIAAILGFGTNYISTGIDRQVHAWDFE